MPVSEATRLVCQTALVFLLALAVAIYQVPAEPLRIRCRYDFDVNLVPLVFLPIRAVPVQKEGLDGTQGILCLHSSLKAPILEGFLCLHLRAAVGLCGDQLYHREGKQSQIHLPFINY